MAVINVILSGGVSSALSSLLPRSGPRQYLALHEGKTAFQLCAERNRLLVDRQLVVSSRNNTVATQENMLRAGVGDYELIIESCPRNTAAAIAFAAFTAHRDDILLVTPSDHVISGTEQYHDAISRCLQEAGQDKIAVIGIQPAEANANFGYIKYEGNAVMLFKEKPEKNIAEQLITEGAPCLVNTAIYCVKAELLLQELQAHCPALYQAASEAWNSRTGSLLPSSQSRLIPALSIEYALMEHTDKLIAVKADFTFKDVGRYNAADAAAVLGIAG